MHRYVDCGFLYVYIYVHRNSKMLFISVANERRRKKAADVWGL